MFVARLNVKRYYVFGMLLYLASVHLPGTIYGQGRADSSALYNKALNNTYAVYNNSIGKQAALYNGPLYYFYNTVTLKGSAFFQESITSFGDVVYDGIAYKNIHLIYDIYKDELITYSFDEHTPFVLLKDNVQSFDLPGHHFVNINSDTLSENSLIKTGYYDELYHGHQQVLMKTSVTVKDVTSSIGTPEAFSTFSSPSQNFYLRKDNTYYRITGESSLIKILQDKKKLLKTFIKNNKIRYGKDPRAALAKIVACYDSLSN